MRTAVHDPLELYACSDRVRPGAGQGYLLLNVQLPDSASVQRTGVMARLETMARETAGVEHTVGISGQSLVLNANAPNLGSMYVMLKEFHERHGPGLSADGIAAHLREGCRNEIREALVTVFGAPPIDGLGTTGGFKIMIEDRGNLGLAELQKISDIVENQQHTRGCKASPTARGPILRGSFSTLTEPSAWRGMSPQRRIQHAFRSTWVHIT